MKKGDKVHLIKVANTDLYVFHQLGDVYSFYCPPGYSPTIFDNWVKGIGFLLSQTIDDRNKCRFFQFLQIADIPYRFWMVACRSSGIWFFKQYINFERFLKLNCDKFYIAVEYQKKENKSIA